VVFVKPEVSEGSGSARIPIDLIRSRTGEEIEARERRSRKCVDVVVPTELAKWGWKRAKCSVGSVTPRMVLKFIATHLWKQGNSGSLWMRMFEKDIPEEVRSTPAWKDVCSPDGSASYKARMWMHLFRDIECDVSNDMLSRSRPLAIYSSIASGVGIDPTSKIVPFAFLDCLKNKNASSLVANERFARHLLGRKPTGPDLSALEAARATMSSITCEVPSEVENAWVVLLCSSTFRGVPLHTKAYRLGVVPILRDPERERAVAAIAAAEAMEREFVAKKAALERAEAELRMRRESAPMAAPIPIAIPLEMDVGSREVVVPYESYPTKSRADVTEIVSLLSGFSGTGMPTKRAAEFIHAMTGIGGAVSDVALAMDQETRRQLSDALDRFARSCGYDGTTNMWIVLGSAYVALYCGGDWVDVLRTINPRAASVVSNPIMARAPFATLGLMASCAIVASIDASERSVPSEFVELLTEYSSMVAATLKREDMMTDRMGTFVRMMIVAYHTGIGYSWMDMWRRFGWSLDSVSATAISEWKKLHPHMPNCVRAAIVSAFAPGTKIVRR